ncbi:MULTISPECIES: molybdopterin converting factor subunit 1 [Microbulbifer]|uniref:molybdopterin converting factor subunit 1 n=1 Tax=Microbulbifer TaxID=48073 RepID=UPI001E4D264A|nr:molybdopterin converting factor subunit 1 [Microbulbifer sp. YPW16]UHQ56588.1 molybdopterin converting factor subunit 1 [Microbulbifer sp. YPW16]
MIRILFFASLREELGCEQLELPVAGMGDISQVRAALQQRGEKWAVALGRGNLQVALNQALAGDSSTVKAGDEVAFFPPVTGG